MRQADARSEIPRGPAARLVWIGRLVAHKRAELIVRGRRARVHRRRDRPRPGRRRAVGRHRVRARTWPGRSTCAATCPKQTSRRSSAQSLLHLNTSQGEGWGLCVLEAAALGVPTVAYDVEGLRDAVRDGQTGWLVREGEELADVVERAAAELARPRPPRRRSPPPAATGPRS